MKIVERSDGLWCFACGDVYDEDYIDHVYDGVDDVDLDISQIAKAVADLTAHDLLKQKFPSRPSERMHMVSNPGLGLVSLWDWD